MRIKIVLLIAIIFSISCTKKVKKPDFINLKTTEDSIYVIAKNKFHCTMFASIESISKKDKNYINIKPLSEKKILVVSKTKYDSLRIFKNYSFKLFYGNYNLKKYDTTYNYGLPFQKNKRYKVLQGHNTTFTHKGNFSKYAIDFKMNTGQTICAIRNGIVIKIIDHFNVGGKNKKYRNKANLIVIAHNDGTFSQYVHLKNKGVLVKPGYKVKKGEPIGYSGNTGLTTEPHLNFALYKPTKYGLVSISYLLDSIPSKKYTKGKFVIND